MSQRSPLTKQVSVLGIGNIVIPVASFLAAPLLARGLGVDGRGELAAAVAPFALFSVAATFGIPDALMFAVARRGPTRRGMFKHSFALLLAGGIGVTFATAKAAELLSGGNAGLERLIVLASLAITPAVLVGGLRGISSGRARWSLVTLERAITALTRLCGLLVLLSVGALNATSATVVMVASQVAGGLAYVGLVGAPTSVDHDVDLLGYRAFYSYGLGAWAGSLSGLLLSRLDQLLIVPLSNETELGIYSVAVNISDVALIITATVGGVLFAADAASRSDELVTKAARGATVGSAMVALLIGATMPWWLTRFFGESFSSATVPCLLLLGAAVLGAAGSVAGQVLGARGTPWLRSSSILAGLAVNAVLIFTLVRPFGATGAAIATVGGSVTASALNIVWLQTRHGLSVAGLYRFSRADVAAVIWVARAAIARFSASRSKTAQRPTDG